MSITNWNNYFPYPKYRDQQKSAIDKILSEFKNGKKYAIVECGTGVGKSAIGLTVARTINNSSEYEGIYTNGSYFLTTQKILQDQYEKDFSKFDLVSLYSSSNYMCKIDKKQTCKDIQTSLRNSNINKKFDKCKYDCCYKNAKKDFIEKDLGITNFSYFLTEKNYSGKLPHKKILVIDEAHNLENELSRFIEISISSYFSEKILNKKIPDEINTQFKMFKWIKDVYLKSLNSKIDFMKSQLQKLGLTGKKIEEFKKISNNYDMLLSHSKKILEFITIYDKENWVFDIEQTESKKYKKFVFKPIDVSHYSKQYLLDFADYIIFMSATIISHEGFMETIGLDSEKTISIKESSPFDPKNSPVIYSPAGKMSAKSIDKTLPVMVDMVKAILNNHKDKKGIIHTHNTRIAKHICNTVRDSRLILAYGENRNKNLEKHIKSKKPTVLISPSMSEGVDLKGNLSDFQIICKVPFPYLGDKVTRKKMNKWSWWYNTQTVRTIIQSLGRSIRSENDKAVTYILDGDWERIKSNCRDYFPENFFKNYHEY
jgi:ATP-dependent DNA helicase DinG